MHRHEVEPDDVELRTKIRGADGPTLTPVSPDAKALFFGASYHADYATILAAPADLPAVADALAEYCASEGDPGQQYVLLRGTPRRNRRFYVLLSSTWRDDEHPLRRTRRRSSIPPPLVHTAKPSRDAPSG